MANSTINYTILIQKSAEQIPYLLIALNFCKEILATKHRSIHCLFFQCEASYLGMNNVISMDDEINIQQQWQDFIKNNQIPTFICTNSALRRGIVDQQFAELYQKNPNLAPMFKLATLGTLFNAIESSERFIHL